MTPPIISPSNPEVVDRGLVPRPGGLSWVGVVTVALAIALGLLLLKLVIALAVPLALLVLSVTIADAVSPLVARLELHMRRGLAVTLVYASLLAAFVLLGWTLLPRLYSQIQASVAHLPAMFETAQKWANQWDIRTAGAFDRFVGSSTQGLAHYVAELPVRVVQTLFDAFIVVFLSLYWSITAPALSGFVRSLFPAQRRAQTDQVLGELSRAMGGYIRGAGLSAIITGTLAGFGLLLIGFPYPVLLGVLTALGEMVPYIGPIIVAIPAVAIALLQSPTQALLTLAVYFVILQLEGHLIAPNVMRSQTGASQATVIFAILAGSSLGGILGALVAIPIAGALRVLLVHVLAPAIRDRVGAPPPTLAPAES